jgi:hypothetical protein
MGAFMGVSSCFLREVFQTLILAGEDLFLLLFPLLVENEIALRGRVRLTFLHTALGYKLDRVSRDDVRLVGRCLE